MRGLETEDHIGRKFGNYRLMRLLGRGGTGDVYLGVFEGVEGKQVAVKVFKTPLTANAPVKDILNFINETRHFRLKHEHIMPILDFGIQRETNLPYLVMDYAPHGSLRQRHPKGTRLPLGLVVYYVQQIADALQYAHNEMVVHRDIKPENLLLGAHDEIRLSDFNIAIVAHSTSSYTTQEMAGTSNYTAPEQLQGNACPASDQYSLAVMVYEWLCGSCPFDGMNGLEVALKHISSPPPSLCAQVPTLSPGVEQVVLKALSKDPGQRFESVRAFADALAYASQPHLTTVVLPSVENPPTPSPAPSRKVWFQSLLIVLVIMILVDVALFRYTQSFTSPHTTSSASPVNTTNTDCQCISDGALVFDTQRSDGSLKQQAASRLKQGDQAGALSLLMQAVAQDSSDAEAQIYLENLRIRATGSPYITIVIGAMLSPDLVTNGREVLQGAYVAQKEFNDGFKLHRGTLVRLLIANSGSQTDYAAQVASQIVRLARTDPTIVGVMGWPFSGRTVAAVHALSEAHIPMVSETATSDMLTGISPYFFRVAPSNRTQGIIGAHYAETVLHTRKAALFVDAADPYSQTLAQDFSYQFQSDGNAIVATEHYTEGKPQTLAQLLQDALRNGPDIIYFAGYSYDAGVLLTDLPPGNLPVLGGDGLYILDGYTSSARVGFSHLHFTATSYPDAWDVLGLTAQKPHFFSEYAAAFDPHKLHMESPYGFSRANDQTILSYDAMVTLLTGCDLALTNHAEEKNITPEQIQQALTQLTGSKSIQGVSGCISLGADGDPINKSIVMLYVDSDGHIQMEPKVNGHFVC